MDAFGNRKNRILISAVVILAVLAVMQVTVFAAVEKVGYVKPSCGKTDISAILEKPELSEEDYVVLYRQTGLTKTGIDRCLARGSEGRERIKRIQSDIFSDHAVLCNRFAPFCCSHGIGRAADFCYLENGDILITASTFIAGCAVGHAGLVTDAVRGEALQAVSYFSKSAAGSVRDFTARLSFMILSTDVPAEVKEEVALYAKNNLTGKSYGVCPSKRDCRRTHCAHLVWYAYKRFGIDLDGNGGFFVTPKNIANSPRVRVVQVFGFDLDKLWQ